MPEASARIPGTGFEKIPKLLARYIEFREFKNADTSMGYFCGNCVYFSEVKEECAIVKSKGEDCNGKFSKVIAPFGYCSLWAPNRSIVK